MKLSRLVFNCIKAAKFSDDLSFTYDAFKKHYFDNDNDYAQEIRNVYEPLNRCIHEISDGHKIPFKVAKIYKGNDDFIPLTGYGLRIKTIINVVAIKDGDYKKLNYRNVGTSQLFILGECPNELYVEYIEDIPNFDEESFRYRTDEETDSEEYDVELSDYGINDNMCSCIDLYVRGYLNMNVSSEQAMAFINEAKRLIYNLDEYQTSFYQKNIKAANRID